MQRAQTLRLTLVRRIELWPSYVTDDGFDAALPTPRTVFFLLPALGLY